METKACFKTAVKILTTHFLNYVKKQKLEECKYNIDMMGINIVNTFYLKICPNNFAAV